MVSMIRRVRRAIPAAAAVPMAAHDYFAGGKPACGLYDPEGRNGLITLLVNDAVAVLAAVDGLELELEHHRLVG